MTEVHPRRRQLGFLLVQKTNSFFLFAHRSPPEGLTLWVKRGGYLVSYEGRWRLRFASFRRFAESFLAHTIRERRLYVDASISAAALECILAIIRQSPPGPSSAPTPAASMTAPVAVFRRVPIC